MSTLQEQLAARFGGNLAASSGKEISREIEGDSQAAVECLITDEGNLLVPLYPENNRGVYCTPKFEYLDYVRNIKSEVAWARKTWKRQEIVTASVNQVKMLKARLKELGLDCQN